MIDHLTPKQIEDFLLIGFNIRCDKKVIEIDQAVLYLLIAQVYKLGFHKGKE